MAKVETKGKKTQRTYSDGVAHILATFNNTIINITCLLYTSPSPRDVEESRMPSSA